MSAQEVERALDCAEAALATHSIARGFRKPDPRELVADLLHYAEREGDDPESVVADALINWRTERVTK